MFITEDAAEVEDHDCIAVLLRGKVEEGEHFGVVVKVADGVVDDRFTRGAELGVLAWMGGQSVVEFCGDFASFGKSLGGERGELVAVFGVAREGEHFAAEAHEFDAVAVVPAEHFGDVADVGEAELLDEFLTSSNVCWLFSVGTVLGCVWRLVGVTEGMAVFENGCDTTGSRAEDWGIRKAKVRIETCLYGQHVSSAASSKYSHILAFLSKVREGNRYSQAADVTKPL